MRLRSGPARRSKLLDCGDGMKQERWGHYTLVRPDPQIIWPRHGSTGKGSAGAWEKWDGFYHRSEQGGGKWEYRREQFAVAPHHVAGDLLDAVDWMIENP